MWSLCWNGFCQTLVCVRVVSGSSLIGARPASTNTIDDRRCTVPYVIIEATVNRTDDAPIYPATEQKRTVSMQSCRLTRGCGAASHAASESASLSALFIIVITIRCLMPHQIKTSPARGRQPLKYTLRAQLSDVVIARRIHLRRQYCVDAELFMYT